MQVEKGAYGNVTLRVAILPSVYNSHLPTWLNKVTKKAWNQETEIEVDKPTFYTVHPLLLRRRFCCHGIPCVCISRILKHGDRKMNVLSLRPLRS